jgi:hypothetical protein
MDKLASRAGEGVSYRKEQESDPSSVMVARNRSKTNGFPDKSGRGRLRGLHFLPLGGNCSSERRLAHIVLFEMAGVKGAAQCQAACVNTERCGFSIPG